MIGGRSLTATSFLDKKNSIVGTPVIISEEAGQILSGVATLHPSFSVKRSPPIGHSTAIGHHTATFELLDAVQPVTASFIETRHVIALRTLTPAFLVERSANFIRFVAVKIAIRQICGFTATTFLDVVKPLAIISIQPLHEVTIWANGPTVVAEQKNSNFSLVMNLTLGLFKEGSMVKLVWRPFGRKGGGSVVVLVLLCFFFSRETLFRNVCFYPDR